MFTCKDSQPGNARVLPCLISENGRWNLPFGGVPELGTPVSRARSVSCGLPAARGPTIPALRPTRPAPSSDFRPGLPPELISPQTQVLPELCPQLQGCGGRREEAWPSSSPDELPRAVVMTFPLGIRAPTKFEPHFRGPQETETSLRMRRLQRQSGNGRSVAARLVPVELGGLGEREACGR